MPFLAVCLAQANATLGRFWGVGSYPKTPFNGFRWNVYCGRAILQAIPKLGRSKIPGLQHKGWFQQPAPANIWPDCPTPACLSAAQETARFAKYQDEQLVHLSLANMGGILLFAPPNYDAGGGIQHHVPYYDHLQAVYNVLDRLVGCASRSVVPGKVD
eukprot:SAG22_NODE_98_length_20720_cov_17.226662_7_plen_158_part_00